MAHSLTNKWAALAAEKLQKDFEREETIIASMSDEQRLAYLAFKGSFETT